MNQAKHSECWCFRIKEEAEEGYWLIANRDYIYYASPRKSLAEAWASFNHQMPGTTLLKIDAEHRRLSEAIATIVKNRETVS